MGIIFAIEDIKPEIGVVKATQVSWDLDKGKIQTPIELQDCAQVAEKLKDNKQMQKLSKEVELIKGRKELSFLCPTNL